MLGTLQVGQVRLFNACLPLRKITIETRPWSARPIVLLRRSGSLSLPRQIRCRRRRRRKLASFAYSQDLRLSLVYPGLDWTIRFLLHIDEEQGLKAPSRAKARALFKVRRWRAVGHFMPRRLRSYAPRRLHQFRPFAKQGLDCIPLPEGYDKHGVIIKWPVENKDARMARQADLVSAHSEVLWPPSATAQFAS